MYIISPFKDYYDIHTNEKNDLPVYVRRTCEWQECRERLIITDVKSHGELPLYELMKKGEILSRKPESKEEYAKRKEFSKWGRSMKHRLPVLHEADMNGAVIFCGRPYPFYKINETICYTYDQVVDVFKRMFEKGDYTHGVKPKRILEKLAENKRVWGGRSRPTLNRYSWNHYLESLKEKPEKHRVSPDAHRFFGAPIMVSLENAVITNPALKDYNFAGQIDPYTAYQEIDMFISNTFIEREKSDLKMSEKLKVHSKGMDEWSFRTKSGDSGKPRRKKKG